MTPCSSCLDSFSLQVIVFHNSWLDYSTWPTHSWPCLVRVPFHTLQLEMIQFLCYIIHGKCTPTCWSHPGHAHNSLCRCVVGCHHIFFHHWFGLPVFKRHIIWYEPVCVRVCKQAQVHLCMYNVCTWRMSKGRQDQDREVGQKWIMLLNHSCSVDCTWGPAAPHCVHIPDHYTAHRCAQQ